MVFVSVVVSILPSLYDASSILGVFPVHSKSHFAFVQPIIESLCKRGHTLTALVPFRSSIQYENYHEIILDQDSRPSYVDSQLVNDTSTLTSLNNILSGLVNEEKQECEVIMRTDYIRQLVQVKNQKPIDLILVDVHYSICTHLLALELDIYVVTSLVPLTEISIDLMIGNLNNPAVLPVYTSNLNTKMHFWQRTKNFIHYIFWYVGICSYANHYMSEIAHKYYNRKLPIIDVLHERVALSLYNSHSSILPRSKVPNAIEIAGVHIQEAKLLSKDIEEFIDESPHGVIFFSFGSAIKSSSMPDDKVKIFRNVFSRIPLRILWRVDDPAAFSMPCNVKMGKWFSQRDILEHKNVKAFLSHGGVLSILESIHTNTPTIVMPFRFDQFQNAKLIEEKEAAIYLDYHTFTEADLQRAIDQIINNTKYAKNMRKLSEKFRDRPETPLDTAVYWIEYVLRHEGISHLRSPATTMNLYQYLLIDVFATVLFFLLVLLYIMRQLLKVSLSFHRKRKVEEGRRKEYSS